MSHEPRSWAETCPPVVVRRDIHQAEEILAALEAGGLVRLEGCAFELEPAEQALMDPKVSDGKSKNVSYDPASGRLGGSSLEGEDRRLLAAMIARYAVWAESLVRRLLPAYGPRLETARTSFRPRPIGGEALSPRKDDRRLHVDAFPSQPVQGRRILRVFTNVDPDGEARVWTLGEGFEAYARRFLPPSDAGAPMRRWLEERLGLTRGRRTAYDRMMLALHDRAKADEAYQATAPRRRLEFAPGDTWLVFTDAAPHAALAGKNAFEQTFLVPVESLKDAAASPLRTLERLSGRALV
jgi:hypothetical protein